MVSAGWEGAALAAAPVAWARVDAELRVVNASPRAIKMMQVGTLPRSLIAFSRTPEIESHARAVLQGATGPWEVVAAHFGRRWRLSGLALGAAGAVLFFEDITELRRLEAVRTEFVANLAHELRTPVTSLRLAIETLSQGMPEKERRVFIGRMLEEADYMSSVLDTLKELADIERGTITVQREAFAVAALVEETWARVASRGTGVTLSSEIPPRMQMVADRPMIGEVLQNLLANAERYSPPDGVVEVGCTKGPADISLWVKDAGQGISPLDLPRIFERFYKVERSHTRSVGRGSGLGLAIAKHLVEAHGGRVWAESSEATGTRVGFTLPDQP
jgi:two-component system phosphate regulon sensor histidine kinase PhoR